MLACIFSPERLKLGEAYALEFGEPVYRQQSAEELLHWVIQDYENRRDHIWDVEVPDAVTILSEMVREYADDPRQLRATALGLGWLGMPRGNEAVEPLLDHADPEVRLAAIRACGQMVVFATVPNIRRFLQSPDRRFRKEAIIALGKYGRQDAIEGIDSAAQRDPELLLVAAEAKRRSAAIEAAYNHRIGIESAAELVLETDEYEDILPYIGFVWERLAGIAADSSRDGVLRGRAIRLLGLGRIGRARNIARRIIVESGDRELKLAAVIAVGRMKGISSIEPLLDLLNGEDEEMKLASITSLGWIGFPTAIDGLLSHWDDQDGSLRAHLRMAIRRSCPLSARELADVVRAGTLPVGTNVRLIDEDLRLTGEFNPASATRLLTHSNPTARRDAILLFGAFGNPLNVVSLEAVESSDPDPVNRELAAQVRRRLER